MRKWMGRGVLLLALGGWALSGCNRSGDTPSPSAQNEPETPAHPTTQELLTGDRTQVDIKSAPLSMKLPPSWKIELVDGMSMLEGPSPSGDATIMVTTLPGMSQQHIEMMVAGAQADAQKKQGREEVHDLHQVNGLRAFEKITYSSSATQPSTQVDEVSAPSADSPTNASADAAVDGPLVSWSRLVFVPFEDNYLPCSFSVGAMTPQEFDQDKAFLQSLLDSAQVRKLEDMQ
jgi:hypothetical protein